MIRYRSGLHSVLLPLLIVVFCRCLCRFLWSQCWRRCLRCAKRCSLCFSLSWIIHGRAGHQRQSLCCPETQNGLWRSATWRHWRTPSIYSEKERSIYLWRIAFCIWLRPRAVHVMHARFARDEIINSLRENKKSTRLFTCQQSCFVTYACF